MLCARLGRWWTALLSTVLPLSSGSTARGRRTAKVCTSFPKSHPDISQNQAKETLQHVSCRAADGSLSSVVQLGKEASDGAWVLKETPAWFPPVPWLLRASSHTHSAVQKGYGCDDVGTHFKLFNTTYTKH